MDERKASEHVDPAEVTPMCIAGMGIARGRRSSYITSSEGTPSVCHVPQDVCWSTFEYCRGVFEGPGQETLEVGQPAHAGAPL